VRVCHPTQNRREPPVVAHVDVHVVRTRRRPVVPIATIVSKLNRPRAPLLLLGSVFVAAGGLVHLREWSETYRHVPLSLPGAQVVRVGFLVNTGASAVLVVALVFAVLAGRRHAAIVVAVAALAETASLATLIQSRRGSVLGWMERGWSPGATESLAVEIGALVMLSAAAALWVVTRRDSTRPAVDEMDRADSARSKSGRVPRRKDRDAHPGSTSPQRHPL
jgi:hypothetical protein